MSDAVALSKSPGLIRRISRGAANRLTRRRTSTNNNNNGDHRDESSGPVVMRRRSDSRTGPEPGRDPPSLDDDGLIPPTTTSPPPPPPMGATEDVSDEPYLRPRPSTGPTSPVHGSQTPSGSSTTGGHGVLITGLGPVIPSILKHGTILTKVTKKKRKNLKFVLDTEAAKVCWDPSKPTKRFYIDDIREIRLGPDARNYREDFHVSAEQESRWFTVVVADHARSKGRPFKTIHLIAPSEDLFGCWTTTLENISRYRLDMMTGLAGQSEAAIRAVWAREMARRSARPSTAASSSSSSDPTRERLPLEGVERLCRSLHVHCSKEDLRSRFVRVDTAGVGALDYAGFERFIRSLMERDDLRAIYHRLIPEAGLGLDRDRFKAFLRAEQRVPAAEADGAWWDHVFDKWTRHHRSEPDPVSIVAAAVDDERAWERPSRMHFEAFAAFLTSEDNAPMERPSRPTVLDRPFNEYFISSSHNTYLVGRQVAGESSTEPYIWALQRGCRCVEVDCWDGPDGRPLVNHGRTLTSSVLFADCIAVIGRFAFCASPYPLIVSLEVHCGPEQQRVMAEILQGTLGDRLLCAPISSSEAVLPSPETLRHRILVKVKAAGEEFDEIMALGQRSPSPPPPPLAHGRHRSISSPSSGTAMATADRISSSPFSIGGSATTGIVPRRSPSTWDGANVRRPLAHTPGNTWPGSATEDSDSREGQPPLPERKTKRKKSSKISKPLGDLGVYTRGQKYVNFAVPESFTYNHVFSFSERTFANLCKDAALKAQLERHNQWCLMRVYPAGYRVNSSNFDPNRFWRRGVQMVALNWQTFDLGLQMNEAMFAAGTDRTGYVLKPAELRPPTSSLAADPSLTRDRSSPSSIAAGKLARKARKRVQFSVEMISAQQLPRPRGPNADQTVAPYIELEIFCADDRAKGVTVGEGGQDASARNGMSGIGSPHRRRTKIIVDNGYNPVFDDRFTVSVDTKFPSLVFLRWSVWNSTDARSYAGDRNGALATFTAKLDSLQEGYRHLPLFDHRGEQFLFATLLCRLQKDEVIPLSEEDVIPLSEDEVHSAKLGSLKQLGLSMFGRSTSIERKSSRDEN